LRRRPRASVVHAVGFSTLTYARAAPRHRLGWFINGIPEERLLYRQAWRTRAAVRASWLLARLGARPDLSVVVSSRMARLVEERLPGTATAVAPTCPRLDRFRPPGDADRTLVTYLGSGAPWQGLDKVAAIWAAMADIDERVRFRVISRDARAKVLTAGVPSDRIEVIGTNDPDEVARMLWQADIGFLVREPDLVNEVSFPTKFGEYVAAGVPVVLSDLDWDLSDIARATDCALLVSPRSSTAEIAKATLAYLERVHADAGVRDRCQIAAEQLSYDYWRERLVAALRDHFIGDGATSRAS
jgi:glycosyltransferase involved in cell wall biosynthesis